MDVRILHLLSHLRTPLCLPLFLYPLFSAFKSHTVWKQEVALSDAVLSLYRWRDQDPRVAVCQGSNLLPPLLSSSPLVALPKLQERSPSCSTSLGDTRGSLGSGGTGRSCSLSWFLGLCAHIQG